ncbi:hypothetical protein [Paenibacillus alvei]|uniref:hypothetical protein n=1 Tax=Paenibacillus alvei TaxID=44250 RepID=UPI0013D920E8|nr:hypothetical protein [Paenibacillus alvei]NEZ45149.1 hypothetical protein [Paenibacillus alvei]
MMKRYSNPSDPVVRLFSLLQHVCLPIPVTPAAIVSGLTEEEVHITLNDSPDYNIHSKYIHARPSYQKALADMRDELGETMTLEEVNRLYQELHYGFLISDGKFVSAFHEAHPDAVVS